jgi:flagellar biogenesis protein FliO
MWTTLSSLGLVIALILVIAKVWKKHGPLVVETVPADALELLGKRHIDQRQTVYLMRLGSRILVLGSSAAGLQPLAEVTDPVEVDYLAGLCRRKESGQSAASAFGSLFKTRSPLRADEDAPTGSQPAERRLAERLRRDLHGGREQSLEQIHG